MLPRAIERIDGWTGQGVESLIRRHHRRRLAGIGRIDQLDPPDDGSVWTAGQPPPRERCELEVLIDGAKALPAVAQALEAARSHVHIAGWHLTPDFGLTRDNDALRLRDLLGDLAERIDVRVLLWAGAPLPVFTPDRCEVRRARDELIRGTRVKCALDANERPMHCHHEKLVIVDGEVAFVGGIDLTSLGGDRFDSSEHPMRSHLGWHDVATRLRALRSARRFVYLESQFLWSPQIVDILADKLRRPPAEDFRVVVLLPARPNNGADTTRGQLGVLADADNGAERFLATTISTRSGGLAGPLYVHAKVGIVDDAWLTVGSANLNEHSLFNDSEMNVVSCDPHIARQTRLRLWSEHLERPMVDLAGDPARVIDEFWRPISAEQLQRRERGDCATHRLRELPGVSRRSMALLGPVQSLLVDG